VQVFTSLTEVRGLFMALMMRIFLDEEKHSYHFTRIDLFHVVFRGYCLWPDALSGEHCWKRNHGMHPV
jgi:hypothetical protein